MKETKFFVAATISQGEIFRSGMDTVFKQNGLKTLQLIDIAIIENTTNDLFYEINRDFSYASLCSKGKDYVQELYRESVIKPCRERNMDISCSIENFNKEQGISMLEISNGVRNFCKMYGAEVNNPLARFIGWKGTQEMVAINLAIGSDLSCENEYKIIEQTHGILCHRAFTFMHTVGVHISYAEFLTKMDYYINHFKSHLAEYPKLTDAPFSISRAMNTASQYKFLNSDLLFKTQSQN